MGDHDALTPCEPGAPRRRMLPMALALLAFAGMAVLYASGRTALYDRILAAWGVDPFGFPFLDTDTVLSAVRCLRAGVDVFAVNPCDALGRVYDYSPLWLLLAHLPFTRAWVTPSGIVVDLAFFASLALLPAGRGRAETGRIVIGVLAPSVVFAVERANNDLVLFVLAAIAATLVTRRPALRAIGYGAALLAGLLKYYPMMLMALALRERPARFLAVAAASVAAVAAFLATMGHDLVRAIHLIPGGSWFLDMFGAPILPGGLAELAGWSPATATGLRVALTLATAAAGLWFGTRPATGAALDRLDERERMFLLVGGLLMIGCFFTAQNSGYRTTHLLLVLPALTALWRLDRRPVWPAATYAALGLLWSQSWRMVASGLTHARAIFLGAWLLREGLWWAMMVLLVALVSALLLRATVVRIALGAILTKENKQDTFIS